jgi:hypothetical protein
MTTVVAFRNRIRNGLYHLAYTKRGLRIHDDDEKSTDDFAVLVERSFFDRRKNIDMFYMNPQRVVRSIITHFPTFTARLRSSRNAVLRQTFSAFFDDFFTE